MLLRFFWHWQPWSYEQILKDFYSISHNLAVFLHRLEALKSDSMNNNVEIHLPVANTIIRVLFTWSEWEWEHKCYVYSWNCRWPVQNYIHCNAISSLWNTYLWDQNNLSVLERWVSYRESTKSGHLIIITQWCDFPQLTSNRIRLHNLRKIA